MPEIDDIDLESLVARLSLDEKILLLTGRDAWSTHPLPSIGLRSIVLSDGPVGVRGPVWDERSPSANLPSPTALAASWDRANLHAAGDLLGSEARRKGVDVVLAPTVNLHRTPYGGRHFESFSEDPYLTSELAREYVCGIQAHGVGATVKHYVANDSETDRFTVDVRVDDRTLRELYLRAFEGPVIGGGAWLVMSAYNSINGVTASENPLLTNPLNADWGFTGVVVSDWTAVRSIESARHPQDLAMPGPEGAWGAPLLEAVRAGEVDESAIDRKVLRILRLAGRVGALDVTAESPTAFRAVPVLAITRTAAAAGTVLLRNDGVLPLGSPTSIALIGEGARSARTQGGGSATVIPEHVVSPWDGLRRRWPEVPVTWAHGAVVQQRPSELTVGSFRTPSGEAGMTVRYLDSDGAEIVSEQREVSSIVSFDSASLAARATTIEMCLSYAPDDAGPTIALALIGLCDYQVEADREIVATGSIRTAPGDDPATAVLTPPYVTLQIPRDAAVVDLRVRFTPVAGGIPGAFAFGIGLPALDLDADELIAEAAELAARNEVAVVVVSTSAEVESEGFDRTTLRLPGRQDELVQAVTAANTRTIVVVNSGAPVLLPWRGQVAAALVVWFPGQEFGDALADVLSGDVEPGGRLPVTWPSTDDVPVRDVTPVGGRLAYSEGLHIGYKAWLRAGRKPAYPFGHGLGYTDWDITALEATDLDTSTDIRATVTAVNTGNRRGKLVVQCYLERLSPSHIERPARWLAGFGSTTADPGEAVELEVRIPRRALAHWDGGWKTEPGDYRLIATTSVNAPGPASTITVPTGASLLSV